MSYVPPKQYADGDTTPANPVGGIIVFDNAGTIVDVTNSNPLPVLSTLSAIDNGVLDDIAAKLGTIDADTGNLAGDIDSVIDTVDSTIDGTHAVLDTRTVIFAQKPNTDYVNIQATAGGNLKMAVEEFDAALPTGDNNIGNVDIVTMPTVTVQATDLDIRNLDVSTDDVLVFANTVKDGSGTSYVPLVDTDGHLQIDILSSALPSGAATAANQQTDALTDTELRASAVPVSLASVPSHNVTNTGTFAVQAAQSGTWNIDTVTAVTAITNALPAGTNAIGKLAANSGVDIGDVDVTSLPSTVHSADYDSGAGTDTTLAFGIAVPASGGAAVIGGDATNGLDVDVTRVSGTVTVDGSGVTQPISAASLPLPSGAATAANQQTDALTDTELRASAVPVSLASVPSHAVTNAGTFLVQENGAALTALQLIDDTVATLGTTTYTEATTKGLTIGAVRRDADTTLVDTTNEVAPLIVDARGFLKVEAFSGETLPVSLASVPSHAVTNVGTFAVQIDGAALTSLQLIDNIVSGAGVNITQMNGVNVTMGNGVSGTGVQRVTIASDSTGSVTAVNETVSTATLTSVADSASSVQLLASTAGRKGASFFNDSTVTAYLKLGTTASTTSFTVRMSPNSFYELPQPVYTGRIDAIWASNASGSMRITELS